MSENLNSKNDEHDEVDVNSEESNYGNLITRLKEIKTVIASLEKTIFK